ncbi:MAG: ribosomal protein L7/L12 [Candidatus Eisenbacteria bacterium]|uniref:Ribosomal protein L7/L12 n=1 Tax=Eiseniibacteriota bacterium TaxID=2212470 RepID=A0A956SDF2_UNCEI|nr:ribosomal protein L7/L12 [Candidatus Eisenbacteria bacterium]MCB9465391.1 ribosomal protein L7/L12 [Candidatus Eisenbacteria bacterium]
MTKRSDDSRPKMPRTPSSPPSPPPADVEARVRELLAQKKKIEAIKLYREATGCGLKEAKEAVESL